MTVTGLFFLPLAPNVPSPTPGLVSHISRKYLTSSSPLPPFQLDHRVLGDTSSQLPNHPFSTHPRRYTQFLALSHLPGKTYVGTSSTAPPPTPVPAATENGPLPATTTAPMAIISIPAGPLAEEFFWIVTRKMEPLWSPRSGLRVEHGVAFTLANGDWRLRLGDGRITLGQGQGRVRGMVAELEFCGLGDDEEGDPSETNEEHNNGGNGLDWEGREKMLKSFWDGLVSGSEVSMERLQAVVKVPGIEKGEKGDVTLVRQYMELLRFART